MSHSDVQKYIRYKNGINTFNFSCTESRKRLWIHYVPYPEITGKIFLVEWWFFFLMQQNATS